MIELAITIAIVWTGLCFFVADAIATRRWHNETITRRIYQTRR